MQGSFPWLPLKIKHQALCFGTASISLWCVGDTENIQNVTRWLFSGSGSTDFAPQLQNLNKKRFTVVAWDPRGYGQSRPPDRDFPLDFFERDAKDAVDLMKVRRREVLEWGKMTGPSFMYSNAWRSFFQYLMRVLHKEGLKD